MLALISGPQSHAAPAPSLAEATVAIDLHPVHDQFMLRWQQHTALAMSGPHASAMFRSPAARMDVHWRLAEAPLGAPVLSTATQERMLELALAGTVMGWEGALVETMARSDGLNTARKVLLSAANPSVRLRKGEDGVRVGVDGARDRNAESARAAMEESVVARRPPAAAPTLRTGVGGRLYRAEVEDEDATVLDEAAAPFVPGAAAFLHASRPGRQALRAEANLRSPSEDADWTLSWYAGIRQQALPGVVLIADARGRHTSALPTYTRAGADIRMPTQRTWVLRAARVERHHTTTPDEIVYELGLRTLLRWRLPEDIHRWPLGHRPGADGPSFPAVADASPNKLVPLVQSPAERALVDRVKIADRLVADRVVVNRVPDRAQ